VAAALTISGPVYQECSSTDAAELRIRAERRLMEMANDLPKNPGTRGHGRPRIGGSKSDPPKTGSATLADMGIGKHLADRGRKLSALHKAVGPPASAGNPNHTTPARRRWGEWLTLPRMSCHVTAGARRRSERGRGQTGDGLRGGAAGGVQRSRQADPAVTPTPGAAAEST